MQATATTQERTTSRDLVHRAAASAAHTLQTANQPVNVKHLHQETQTATISHHLGSNAAADLP